MTRKDYKIIAKALKSLTPWLDTASMTKVVDAISDALYRSYDNFNLAKFCDYAGIKSSKLIEAERQRERERQWELDRERERQAADVHYRAAVIDLNERRETW